MRGKTLPSGKQAVCSGFTLIELLVVLSIIGGILSVSVPIYARAMSRIQIASAAEKLLSDLNQARRMALTQARTVEIDFSPESSTYIVEGIPRRLKANMNLIVSNGEKYFDNDQRILRFYPDRSADPFSIEISEGFNKTLIKINEVTGQINVQ